MVGAVIVLNVDNTDLALRPGMTATAEITVQQVKNAILVPNVEVGALSRDQRALLIVAPDKMETLVRLRPRPQQTA